MRLFKINLDALYSLIYNLFMNAKRDLIFQEYKKILTGKKISKYRIAKECKVAWFTVHNWFKGIYSPQQAQLKKIKRFVDKLLLQ